MQKAPTNVLEKNRIMDKANKRPRVIVPVSRTLLHFSGLNQIFHVTYALFCPGSILYLSPDIQHQLATYVLYNTLQYMHKIPSVCA